VPTYLTCAVVETSGAHAFDLGLALRMDAPAGTAVREDPHAPEVLYLESSTEAPDPATALVSCGLHAAELITAVRLPAEVAEVVVVGPEGALCWVPTADEVVPAGEAPIL